MSFPQDKPGFHTAFDSRKNTYYQRVCVIAPDGRVPGHQCLGKNRVREFDGFFKQLDIVKYINETGMEAQSVSFGDIWYQEHGKGEREDIIRNDLRYEQAKTDIPGILAPIRNPENKAYRLIDGRRRMWKQEERGMSEGLFYVIPKDEVFRFFWMALPIETVLEHLNKMQRDSSKGN